MSGKKNYKRFQTEKKQCRNWTVSSRNYIPPLRKSPLRCTLSNVLCAYTHVYTRGEEEEKPPEPGGFSLASLQNVGGLLYFCPGGKEANGPVWEGGGGCLSREPQMLRKPKRWCSFCIGSAALPGRPCPPAPLPGPTTPAAYLRYGGFLAPRRLCGNLLLFIA